MSSPPVISALPAVPATSDPNFETLAPALFSAIKNSFIGEVNAVASWINAGSWLTTPLAVSSGGTGASTFSSGKMLYGNGTGALQAASGVSTDGTNLSTGGNLGVTGNASVTGNLAVDTNTFVVDAANNRVGINQSSPQHYLDILAAVNGSGYGFNLDTTTRSAAEVVFNIIGTSGSSVFNMTAGGTTTLQFAVIAGNLTVDTDTLFVDAANNRVGIGTANPLKTLHTKLGADQNFWLENPSSKVRISAVNDAASAYVPIEITGSTVSFNGSGGAQSAVFDSSGNLAVGAHTTALGKLDSRSTSGAQLVASYDGSNYTTITTNSSGDCTIAPTGDGLTIDGDDIRINQAPAASAGSATGTYARINFNGTYYKIALLADA